MAEPPIQFVKTNDGVTIAFWAAGAGEPLVWIEHVPLSHLEAEWQMPYFVEPHRAAMASRRVVRFDPRGCGLSERGRFDYSLKTQLIDLQAVVHHLGIDRFAIWGDGLGSRAAIA